MMLTSVKYIDYTKEYEKLESPLICLFIALMFQMFSLLLQTLHLVFYSYNGQGYPVADIFSMISLFMSETTMCILINFLGNGWTLIPNIMDMDNFDVYLPLIAVVVAAHLIIAGTSYIDNEAAHKFHDYGGYHGIALFVCKLLLLIYYIYSVCVTVEEVPKKSKKFYLRMAITGGLYMIATPIIILFA